MIEPKPHIVVIGATSEIARHCTIIWANKETCKFTLVARNLQKLNRVVKDLKVRHPQTDATCETLDFNDPNAIEALVSSLPTPDIVLIAHGSLSDQSACQNDLDLNEAELKLNGVSPVLFAESFCSKMEQSDKNGTIAIIGSVAGDRGRKSNYVYGAAKSLIDTYVQGLQHRLAKSNLTVSIIKPGPTDTPMTTELKDKGIALASPESVARDIISGIDKKHRVIYTPAKWRYIMMIVRNIPHFLFKNINI